MPDPLLVAHAVYPFTFDISGRLTPISIRDQMVRARMIVDHAYQAGLIGEGRPLVVAGAGAAGATAAMHAASRYKIQTLLVEKEKIPFGVQAYCSTRWVDPVQYDWPCTHWHEGHYAARAPRMPLFSRANYANILATGWTTQFYGALRTWRGILHFAPQMKVTNATLIRPTHVGIDLQHVPTG